MNRATCPECGEVYNARFPIVLSDDNYNHIYHIMDYNFLCIYEESHGPVLYLHEEEPEQMREARERFGIEEPL